MKQTILRIIILFAGLVVAHLGVSLFLLADLGSDPFNVMILGLSRMMDIGFMTHGNTHMVISILIIIVLLFVDKSCVAYDVFESGTRKDVFMLCETWASWHAHTAHIATASFKELMPKIEACGIIKADHFEFCTLNRPLC